jgi:predicted metal-dependent phosphoesterase TrpH
LTTEHFNGRADLHMHTTASDGLYSARDVLDDIARRAALDVIAITDHDVLDASLWAYARRDQYPFDIVPGVEISSADGHVLALWVTEPIPPKMSLKETAAAVHEQGGIAIYAHPCHYYIAECARGALKFIRNPQAAVDAGIDAIEVHNAGVFIPGSNRLAQRLARTLPLSQVANSDAHTLGAIGSAFTRFPGSSALDLRAAFAARQTVPVNGVWSRRDYGAFVRDLFARRGCVSTSTPFEFTLEFDEEVATPSGLDIVSETVFHERLQQEGNSS